MLIMLETRTNNAKSYGLHHESHFYHNGLGHKWGGAAVLPLGGLQWNWFLKPQKIPVVAHFYLLKLRSLKNGVLESSRLDF